MNVDLRKLIKIAMLIIRVVWVAVKIEGTKETTRHVVLRN